MRLLDYISNIPAQNPRTFPYLTSFPPAKYDFEPLTISQWHQISLRLAPSIQAPQMGKQVAIKFQTLRSVTQEIADSKS
jgi:hypothetical protein